MSKLRESIHVHRTNSGQRQSGSFSNLLAGVYPSTFGDTPDIEKNLLSAIMTPF